MITIAVWALVVATIVTGLNLPELTVLRFGRRFNGFAYVPVLTVAVEALLWKDLGNRFGYGLSLILMATALESLGLSLLGFRLWNLKRQSAFAAWGLLGQAILAGVPFIALIGYQTIAMFRVFLAGGA